jgi:hypothetical protein
MPFESVREIGRVLEAQRLSSGGWSAWPAGDLARPAASDLYVAGIDVPLARDL